MHLGRFFPGLAAADALNSLINRRGESQCLKDCVHKVIEPFVVAGAEEGFRMALGAHNTRETCIKSRDCMGTVQTFVEEITQMVFKDRLDDGNGHFAKSPADGYNGTHCDTRCLMRTVQTAAGHAGAVAMAVGQKHFYGNDAYWNRWSPQQILELDRAIRQLKGRNLAETAYVYEADASNATAGHMEAAKTPMIRKLDLNAFRYNGTAEVPLVHHPKITRAMARKILSHIPGWGADPNDVSHDAELGDATVPTVEYFLTTDLSGYDVWGSFDKKVRDIAEHAYRSIAMESEKHGLAGFAHFLYHTRLFPQVLVQNATVLAMEPWDRVLMGVEIPIRISLPYSESVEDTIQLGAWVWQHHAYAVTNCSYPVPNTIREWDVQDSEIYGYAENQNEGHGLRLVQWVTDSKAEPLKGVEEGYTHQPWTLPWFFEFPSNYSSLPSGLRAGMRYSQEPVYFHGTNNDAAFAFRGYTFELKMYRKSWEKGSLYYFRDHVLNNKTGAVMDLEMIRPLEAYDDEWWPLVTAITGDGRAFRRKLSKEFTESNGRRTFDVLTPEKKPIFDETGEPIRIVVDMATGLAETKYGRALRPLDKNMGGL